VTIKDIIEEGKEARKNYLESLPVHRYLVQVKDGRKYENILIDCHGLSIQGSHLVFSNMTGIIRTFHTSIVRRTTLLVENVNKS